MANWNFKYPPCPAFLFPKKVPFIVFVAAVASLHCHPTKDDDTKEKERN